MKQTNFTQVLFLIIKSVTNSKTSFQKKSKNNTNFSFNQGSQKHFFPNNEIYILKKKFLSFNAFFFSSNKLTNWKTRNILWNRLYNKRFPLKNGVKFIYSLKWKHCPIIDTAYSMKSYLKRSKKDHVVTVGFLCKLSPLCHHRPSFRRKGWNYDW